MTENSWPALNLDPNSVPDLVGWLARRDTVRQFDPGAEIPDEDVRELVDAGRKAPTSGTLQMYSFLWIRDAGVKERIHALCDWGTSQIEESSHVEMMCVGFPLQSIMDIGELIVFSQSVNFVVAIDCVQC